MRNGFRAPAAARAEARRALRAGTVDRQLARMVAAGRPLTIDQARTAAACGASTRSWVDRLEQRAVDLTVPKYVRDAARRGLELHGEDLSGDGVVSRTVREASDMAKGKVTADKVIRANAWGARHAVDLDAAKNSDSTDPGYPGPGAVAHLLWGIDPLDPEPARRWFAAKAEAIKNDRTGDLMPETRAVDPANLPVDLSELLACTVAFQLRAHSAHVNVKGGMFTPWHDLFGRIYTDTFESVDPLAENLRKIGAAAPLRLGQIVALRGVEADDPGTDPMGLAADLLVASDDLIDHIAYSFDCATACGQQGIANFLAERMDAHQGWRWQLAASLGMDVPADSVVIDVEHDDDEEEEPVDPADDLIEDVAEDAAVPARAADRDEAEERRGLIERADKATFDAELRADDSGTTIRGYAVRWNVEADGLSFREQFAPGAFTRSLGSGTPVYLLVNHDADMVPLASTKSGTLRLRQDDLGLAIEADLDPANPRAQELMSALKRGDINKMSFAFSVDPDGQSRADGLRTVNAATLHEVSVVTWPAYSATSVGMRSAEDLERRRRRLSLLMAD